MTRAAAALAAGVAVACACGPIHGVTRPAPPSNGCPCDGYPRDARNVAVTCDRQPDLPERCISGVRGADPGYDFTIVVSVPDTSVYGAGQTFFATNAELTKSIAGGSLTCKAPTCLPLRQLVEVTGAYTVQRDAAVALGAPFDAAANIPLRVVMYPQFGSPPTDAVEAGLPADPLFASSVHVPIDDETSTVQYRRELATGTYARYAYPEPPYDAIVPPAVNVITVARAFDDAFSLGAAQLDDASKRHATVQRADGLDGFRIWLAETKTARRVSVVKSLAGTKAEAVLHTVGQAQAFTDGLLDVVVAPPETWIGVPTKRSTLIGGVGLKDIVYPPLPQPLSLSGIVGTSESGVLKAIKARLSFRSRSIRTTTDDDPLLEYAATVSTDDAGGFATVLPPGIYDIVVEPEEGTGFSKFEQPAFDVRVPALKIEAAVKRATATGRAVIADGRPLAGAQVIALAAKKQTDPAVVPRPGRTQTNDDGTFTLELDRGDYEIWVQPHDGTGFPRVVTLRPITADRVDLGKIDVPPPTRFAFDIKEPSGFSNPIVRAVVRAYAVPACASPPCPAVEIASTMTDQDGRCEILLAEEPR